MVYTSLFKHLLLNNSLLLNSVINEYLLPYFHLVTQHDLYYTFDTTCDSDLSEFQSLVKMLLYHI